MAATKERDPVRASQARGKVSRRTRGAVRARGTERGGETPLGEPDLESMCLDGGRSPRKFYHGVCPSSPDSI